MGIKIECVKCGRSNEAEDTQCWKCKTPISEEQRRLAMAAANNAHLEAKSERSEASKHLVQAARDTGDWSEVPLGMVAEESEGIILTTSFEVACRQIDRELEILTAECVYGMNIFRDFFAAVRDIVGGRSAATQKVLRDARRTVLAELRREALMVGADAVIAIDLDYQELSGGGKGGMLMIVASGTAVTLK